MSLPASKTVNVVPVSVPPVISTFATPVLFIEGLPPVPVAAYVTVREADSPNFDTGVLTVQITANAEAGDRLGVRHQGNAAGQIGVSGANVTFGTTLIGTLAGGVGATPLTVTLNANATAAAVTALLRNVTFANVSTNPSNRPRTVQVLLLDGDGGTSAPAAKSISVFPLNTAPVITGFGGVATFTEKGVPVLLDDDAVVVDDDSPDFYFGMLTARFTAGAQATDRLAIQNQGTGTGQIGVNGANVMFGGVQVGTFWGGLSGAPLSVWLNARATPDVVQTVLRSITFQSTSENPSATPRMVSVTLSDGDGGTSRAVSKTIQVVPVNDAPVITGFDGTVNFVKNGPAVVIDADAVVRDVDSPNFAGGTLTAALTDNAEATDRLAIRNQGNWFGMIGVSGANVTYGGVRIGTWAGGDGGNPLVVTLNAAATLAAVQTLLRNITFASTAAVPSLLPRTVSVTIDDGDGGDSTSIAATKTVNIVSNTVIAGWDTTMTYRENAAPLVLDAFVIVTDPDSPHFNNGVLSVSITQNAEADDRLGIRHQGNGAGQIGINGADVTFGGLLIGTFTGGTGATPLDVTLNANATPAAVRALIQNLTFANVSDNPSTLQRRVQLVLTEGDGTPSAAVSKRVNLVAVNDAPVVANFGGSANYSPGGVPVLVTTTATVADPDSFDFHMGRLTAQLVANAQATDRLTIRNEGTGAGQVGVNGTTVTFGATAIGTLSGGAGTTALTVTFNQNATREAVEAVLQNVLFFSTTATPSLLPRTLRATLSDGDGGTSQAVSKAVNVA
ncbi:MAG: hypothetical protein IT428_05720 [Planctomycetaceae bacterium]|nr:hypothetical protein [Planctomycetaceae bacterium]